MHNTSHVTNRSSAKQNYLFDFQWSVISLLSLLRVFLKCPLNLNVNFSIIREVKNLLYKQLCLSLLFGYGTESFPRSNSCKFQQRNEIYVDEVFF